MVFKGRTVLAFILLAMFAGAILTLTFADSGWSGISASAPAGGRIASEAEKPAGGGLNAKDIDKLTKTFQLIDSHYLTPVDHDKVVNGAINGMIGALDDPFTSYMDAAEAKQFQETISSSFEGIGAEVSSEEGRVTIMSPIKDSPAEKAGLHAKDVIVSVNGEKLDGLTLSQAVAKIRGPKGTQAKLGILRGGSGEPVEVIVVRDEIPLETVKGEMVGGASGIGKIAISQFSYNTAETFRNELVRLEGLGMKALIIDVRNDPGGLLESVLKIMENFIPKDKAIVQIENREGKRQPNLSTAVGPVRTYPVAVLINGGSASASEILAGAFKEAAGGKLVGVKTFGKGTVQVSYDKELGDGSNLKMTVYKWLTPNGNWIHKTGIEPDVKVEEPEYYRITPFTKKTVLKIDTVGTDVKTLQVILDGLGFKPDRKDGYFSGKTVEAVKAYQADRGLPVNGEVDTAAMNKLEQDIIGRIRDPKNDQQLEAAVKLMQDALQGK